MRRKTVLLTVVRRELPWSRIAPLRAALLAAASLLYAVRAAGALETSAPREDVSGGAPAVPVEVRMMSEAELSSSYEAATRNTLASGVFYLPAKLTTTPASGNIAAPVGPPPTLEFKAQEDAMRDLLAQSGFPEMLQDELRRRLGAAPPDRGQGATLAVALAAFGVQARDGRPLLLDADDDFCFVTRGIASLQGREGPIAATPFSLGVGEPSPGMAQPSCSPFSRLAENAGLRLRQVMRETAARVADWIVANAVLRFDTGTARNRAAPSVRE